VVHISFNIEGRSLIVRFFPEFVDKIKSSTAAYARRRHRMHFTNAVNLSNKKSVAVVVRWMDLCAELNEEEEEEEGKRKIRRRI
jgi:hypothetical protein